MMMMLMPIHVGVPWLSFLASLSGPALTGIHAFPPSLICESFWFLNTVHSFTFTFIFVIVITELNFFAWVLSSSSYHSTWTLCTPPHQHNHAHPISVCNTFCCVWQKVHLASCTLLKTPYLDTWNGITHEFIKMSFWKEREPSSYCFWPQFDLFIFNWSSRPTCGQKSWLVQQPHSWPNDEDKKWPLRQNCHTIMRAQKTSKKVFLF